MKEIYKSWLLENAYSENTANNYCSAINQISKDLSAKMCAEIDLFKIRDLHIIAKFTQLYEKTGAFAEFGDNGHGTIRNAFRKYFEFLIEK